MIVKNEKQVIKVTLMYVEEDRAWKECDSVGHFLTLFYALCFGKPSKGYLEISVASGTPQVAERLNQPHYPDMCHLLGRGSEAMPKQLILAGKIYSEIHLRLASLTVPLRFL